MTGPYAAAFDLYWQAGWRGIIPLPEKQKKHPPSGYTGSAGVDPSYADIYTWIDTPHMGEGNICLRLPTDIIGVDVDDYDGKTGGTTLQRLERELGQLPDTWRSTSRDDGTSGIRLYRAPAGMSWEDFGPDIEVIHRGWRYVVTWPSIHPEGRTYRWIDPQGVVSTVVPNIDTLPLLPQPWVQRFTRGPAVDISRNTLKGSQAALWLASVAGATATPCTRMAQAVHDDTTRLGQQEGSAHDLGCAAIARVVRLAAEGHPGALTAAQQLHVAFIGNVTNPKRRGTTRTTDDADREWRDLLTSAVNLVSVNPASAPSCDCNNQLTDQILAGATPLPPAPSDDHDDPSSGAGDVDVETVERTTWWPRDLRPVLTGEQPEDPPSILSRLDGQPLWYRGKVNGLIGESESGKTWIALEAVRQVLAAGGRVLYLDFEDAAPGIVSRLRALGTPDDQLGGHLAYVDPAEALHIAAQADLAETLTRHTYDLIVLDGFNAAMTLLGLDLMSNTDATKFSQTLLKPLARTGAAVAYVDHIPKNMKDESSGGIGAQAKRAMTTGCALRVKVREPFGKGMTGELLLTVDKDRAGHVRGNSGGGKNAGIAILVSDGATGDVTVEIGAPDLSTSQQRSRGLVELRWEKVTAELGNCAEDVSTTTLHALTGGKKETLIDDLEALRARGYVADMGTAKNHKWRLVRAFTIAEGLSTTPARSPFPPVPARSGNGEPMSVLAVPPVPTPMVGTGNGQGTALRNTPKPFLTEDGMVDPATGEILTRERDDA